MPLNEQSRLAALRALNIQNRSGDDRFESIINIAKVVLDFPICVISLIEEDWLIFKGPDSDCAPRIPRDSSFCSHVIDHDGVLEISDPINDQRFANSTIVQDGPIQYYAGHALKNAEGYVLGSFCVLDYKPRELSAEQKDLLAQFAGLAESELNRGAATVAGIELDQGLRFFRDIIDDLPFGVTVLDSQLKVAHANTAWLKEFYGQSLDGGFHEQFYEDIISDAFCDCLEGSCGIVQGARDVLSGEQQKFDRECSVESGNTTRWYHVQVSRLAAAPGHIIVVHRDVTQRKQAEQMILEQSDRIRRLHSVVAMPEQTEGTTIKALLAEGCRLFGLEMGLISRIEGNTCYIEHIHAPGTEFHAGLEFDVSTTYCSMLMEQDESMFIERMGDSELSQHLCYRTFGFEVFIGAPLWAHGKRYGATTFYSRRPLSYRFNDGHRDLASLIARWAGVLVDRLHARQELERQAEELQEINRSMTNREIRIIEMKEEVNALAAELGRPAPYPPVWQEEDSTATYQ